MRRELAYKVNEIFKEEFLKEKGRPNTEFDIRSYDRWFVRAMTRLLTGNRPMTRRKKR